jgi:hypothetical protein
MVIAAVRFATVTMGKRSLLSGDEGSFDKIRPGLLTLFFVVFCEQ